MTRAADDGVPAPRYIPADHVLAEMASFGHRRLTGLTSTRVLVLAMLAGGFITAGAISAAKMWNSMWVPARSPPGNPRRLDFIHPEAAERSRA